MQRVGARKVSPSAMSPFATWTGTSLPWQCALLALVLTGCRAADEACLVKSAEPLITIQEVRDAATNALIPEVSVAGVLFLGSPVTDLGLLVDPKRAPTIRVSVVGQTLRCIVACGFAANSGAYRLLIGAPGYLDREVLLNADYSLQDNGCPKLRRGGPKLVLSLLRA